MSYARLRRSLETAIAKLRVYVDRFLAWWRRSRNRRKPSSSPGSLGISWSGDRDAFAGPSAHLDRMQESGAGLVCIAPVFPYVGRDSIDVGQGPSFSDQRAALQEALGRGMELVYSPRLAGTLSSRPTDPGDRFPWRRFFAVDPLTPEYRDLILEGARMLRGVLREAGDSCPAVRFDIGSELLTSVLYHPQSWLKLLRRVRRELGRGRGRQVLVSHHFSPDFLSATELGAHLPTTERRALAEYIRNLDALSFSPTRDLTITRKKRRKAASPEDVEAALAHYERVLVEDVLQGALGVSLGELPELHIAEFGVGVAGLTQPDQNPTRGAVEKNQLKDEATVAHLGLCARLQSDQARRVQSALIWIRGAPYDVYGWKHEGSRNEAIVEAHRQHHEFVAGTESGTGQLSAVSSGSGAEADPSQDRKGWARILQLFSKARDVVAS